MYRTAYSNAVYCKDNFDIKMVMFVPFGTATTIVKSALSPLQQKVYKCATLRIFLNLEGGYHNSVLVS